MNAGEYGIQYNINTGYDMSGATSLNLTITRPDGSQFTASSPDVSVGNADLNTGYVVFKAKQYSQYVFKNGDIPVSGNYTARLVYNDATKHLISSPVTFTVNP